MKKIFWLLLFFGASILFAANLQLLPKPALNQSMPLNQVILKRRSIRSFLNQSLTKHQIANLLWAAQGLTDPRGFRTVPSAGALYPLEIYLISKEGTYHYLAKKQALKKINNHDLRKRLSSAAFNQAAVENAAVDIVIVGVLRRTAKKYGSRALRYLYLEAGHAAQNVMLETTAMNLGGVPIGAFSDRSVQKLLKLQRGALPLYILSVGQLRSPK